MGVLEDAIREHLDLKRQHGASDEELTQQEADALGPARRELPESEAEAAEATDDDAAEHADPEAPESDPVEAPEAAVEPPPVEPDPVVEPPVAPPPVEPPPAEPPPVEAPKHEDPDFGADAPEQTSPRDLDFD
jgi:hypothetical protein